MGSFNSEEKSPQTPAFATGVKIPGSFATGCPLIRQATKAHV
jgi:hypothetical protein